MGPCHRRRDAGHPALALTANAQATAGGVDCGLPESNAEALVILNNYYPNRYTWDHANLTIAVQAQPASPRSIWTRSMPRSRPGPGVLEDCFGGLITLTNVTGTQPSVQRAADIVIHDVRRAGGAVFSGMAVCGVGGCPNVLVSSEAPPSWGQEPYSPELLGGS